jgi:curved DNA-binding protein CbpA
MREAPGNGPSSVASQLRAFLRDPSHWRPRFLRGREPLPDGTLVLRFAQGRFPRSLQRDLPASDREEVRTAGLAFIRQVCFWDGATHYQVLCAASGARRDAIKEHYHLMMALIHPDRHDATAEPWPTGSAQRVNQAYAVLSDAAQRREYDASLQRLAAASTHPPHVPEPPRESERGRKHRRGATRVWLAKATVVLVAVVATLLVLESWIGGTSNEYSVLQGAFSARRASERVANAEHPRYLGAEAGTPREAQLDSKRAGGFSLLDPLWRAWESDPVVEAPVVRVAPRPTAAAAVEVPARAPVQREIVEPPAIEPPAKAKTTLIAQAPQAPKAPAPAVSAQDIEILVARLVGYYEAGETDKIMSLLDSGDASFWQTARTRQAYYDFFRATRQRKLRVDNLAWQTAAQSAQAKGEATVVAEYFDTPGMLERRVEVEMDIALRDGMPKITRLSLFPDAR